MALNPLKGRIEILAYTLFSVVYAVAGDTHAVWKGEEIWLDGKSYDRRPFAGSGALQREAKVYDVLGKHARITRCYGLHELDSDSQVYALRLERAPKGSFRQYIINSEAPPMDDRLRMAADFADGVQHLHECGVTWGDISVRNSLLFDHFRVKLCDFGGALLKGTDYEISQTYETRYTPPGRDQDWEQISIMTREFFALGSAIYEITEWEVPYGTKATEEEVEDMLARKELPKLSKGNPAGDIITRCWTGRCNSAQEVVHSLNQAVLQPILRRRV